MAMMITFIFLVLLLLSVLTFTILTAIRQVEFEEALATPGKDENPQEEQPR
jgi:Na+-transporting methylmalonyl-CoA/oxaloacetate decarboxylase gamma subunit